MACKYIFRQPDGTTKEFDNEAAALLHIRTSKLWERTAKKERADFTTDTLAAALRQATFGENNFDPTTMRSFQTTMLDEFIRIEKQSEYFYKMGAIVALTKGLGKDFAQIDKIKENLKALGIGDEMGNDIPFDVRYILTGEGQYRTTGQDAWFHNISANNIRIMREIDALSRTMFMERTTPFTDTTDKVIANLRDELPATKTAEIKDELSAFFQIAAYKTYLEMSQHGTSTLRNSLIYDVIPAEGDTLKPTIVDIAKEAINLAPDNAFLKLILPVSTTVKIGKREIKNVIARDLINTIEGKTRGKLEPDVVAGMMDSFLELYTNPATKFHAKALFDYLVVKDGLMYKNKSFIKFIPTIMFKEVSDATSMATKLLAAKSEAEIKALVKEFHQIKITGPLKQTLRMFTSEDIQNFNRWFAPATADLQSAKDLLYRKVFGRTEKELYQAFEAVYATDARFQYNLHRVTPRNVVNKITHQSGQAKAVSFLTDERSGLNYMHVDIFPASLKAFPARIGGRSNPQWIKHFDAILDELKQAKFFKSQYSTESQVDEEGNITRSGRTYIEFKKFIQVRDESGKYVLHRLVMVRREDASGRNQDYYGADMTPPGELVPRGIYAVYEPTAVVGTSNTTGVANLPGRPTIEMIKAAIAWKQRRGGLPPETTPPSDIEAMQSISSLGNFITESDSSDAPIQDFSDDQINEAPENC